MGLKDSATVFQKLAHQTLADLPNCEPYIDDILVYGSNLKEHDENLLKVFKRLDKKNFRLNLDKCVIAATSVPFLGHIISAGELRPDPKNVESIKQLKDPTNIEKLRCLLGMVNYLFPRLPPKIHENCRIAARAHQKRVKFKWTDRHQHSFQKIKQLISNDLKMGIFDLCFPRILSTDASNVGIGGVLS